MSAIENYLPLIAVGVWLWFRPLLKGVRENLPTDKTRPSAEHVADSLLYHPDPYDDKLFFLRKI
jgi:hypothetical protein